MCPGQMPEPRQLTAGFTIPLQRKFTSLSIMFCNHCSGFVTTHEGRNVDWPVYIQLCFYVELSLHNRSVESLHCRWCCTRLLVYLPLHSPLWTSSWDTWGSNFLIQGGHSTSLTRNHDLRFWGVNSDPQTTWVWTGQHLTKAAKPESYHQKEEIRSWNTEPHTLHSWALPTESDVLLAVQTELSRCLYRNHTAPQQWGRYSILPKQPP